MSKTFSQNISNNEIASLEKIIEKPHKAAELLKSMSKEGLEILRDRKFEFMWKDMYIFVIDVEKRILSNPAFSERQGGNIREHMD